MPNGRNTAKKIEALLQMKRSLRIQFHPLPGVKPPFIKQKGGKRTRQGTKSDNRPVDIFYSRNMPKRLPYE